jgi:ferritin-like metal-binding protein YciE
MSTDMKTDMPSSTTLSEAGRDLLAKYVGDMAALETHIEEALDRQLDVSKDDPVSGPAIREFHDMVRSQRDTMIELRDSLGSNAANPIKELGSNLLGMAAGLIDKVRADALSKSLRDDYVAFNLAAISYSMLYTTAKGVGSDEVASAAKAGLKNYARAVQRINHLMPDVVLSELADEDGITVIGGVAEEARRMTDKAWKSTSGGN